MVLAPTIGSTNELVFPTSAPPLATTSASSPPDDESPKTAFSDALALFQTRHGAGNIQRNGFPFS